MLIGNYKKNKERLQKKVWERYQNLSQEEKTKSINMPINNIEIFLKKKAYKKHQYGRECYRNLPEDEKQRLVENRKKIILKSKK